MQLLQDRETIGKALQRSRKSRRWDTATVIYLL